jgi:hypothetical protein
MTFVKAVCFFLPSLFLYSYDSVHGLRECGSTHEWLAVAKIVSAGSIWPRGKYWACHVWPVGGRFLLSKGGYTGMN